MKSALPSLPKAIVFDLDGTLIDSRLDICASVNATLVRHGRTALSVAQISAFVGDGARELLRRAAELPLDSVELNPLLEHFLEHYTLNPVVRTTPFPGVETTLQRLQTGTAHGTYQLALCTNKPRGVTEPILDRLNLRTYFDVVTCGDDFPERKPHPAALHFIAGELRLSTSDLLMVGDSPQDILCGKRAGARTLGVTYGFKTRQQLQECQPDGVIDSFAQLLELLTSKTAPHH